MAAAVGNRTYRHVAELTGASAESVRRYMDGAPPSAEFLTGLCRALGISGEWLLTGRGPMRAQDVGTHALRQAGAPDLLAALANSVETLIDRVERLEVFVSTMEVRLRGRGPAAVEVKPQHGPDPAKTPAAADRARAVARAVAKRPSPDDRPDAPTGRA